MNTPIAALIDAGPFVAFVNKSDSDHKRCLSVLRQIPSRTRIVTVAPVLTEAFHLLFRVPSGPERLFELIDSIAVEISPLDVSLLGRVRVLMNKYSNVPMSFADAVLVAVAERERIDTIFTLDRRGFDTYKLSHISRLRII